MPQPPPVTVLLTRPQAASERFARMLRAAEPAVAAVIAPLMRIVPVPHDSAALQAAPVVVLTSAEAVPAAGAGAGRRALCVGGATADAAAAAGFAVEVGQGGAEALLPLIAARPGPMIHPHGRHIARRLPVPGMVVYDQVALDPDAALLALLAADAPLVLPLFSPRSAALAAQAAAGARAPIAAVAISDAAAAGWGAPVTATAALPDAAAMRDAVLAVWAALTAGEQSPLKPG